MSWGLCDPFNALYYFPYSSHGQRTVWRPAHPSREEAGFEVFCTYFFPLVLACPRPEYYNTRIGHWPSARIFCGGVRERPSGPNYRNAFIDCPRSRLFQIHSARVNISQDTPGSCFQKSTHRGQGLKFETKLPVFTVMQSKNKSETF